MFVYISIIWSWYCLYLSGVTVTHGSVACTQRGGGGWGGCIRMNHFTSKLWFSSGAGPPRPWGQLQITSSSDPSRLSGPSPPLKILPTPLPWIVYQLGWSEEMFSTSRRKGGHWRDINMDDMSRSVQSEIVLWGQLHDWPKNPLFTQVSFNAQMFAREQLKNTLPVGWWVTPRYLVFHAKCWYKSIKHLPYQLGVLIIISLNVPVKGDVKYLKVKILSPSTKPVKSISGKSCISLKTRLYSLTVVTSSSQICQAVWKCQNSSQKLIEFFCFFYSKDLPTFTHCLQRFVNDLRYFRLCNNSLPEGSIKLWW